MNTRKFLLFNNLSIALISFRYYAGLGSVLDFSDNLIQFAYERQCTCDPVNLPYYLECLQGIAEGRNSEDLRTRTAIEASTGKLSMRDIREAYRSLGLDAQNPLFDDDHIIGVFRSRVSDAPAQEGEMRQALALIGHHRRSSKIEQFASNSESWPSSTTTPSNVFRHLNLYTGLGMAWSFRRYG